MTTKRLGSRYGRRVRNRLKAIESIPNKQLCPNCRKPQAKRISIGIYTCSKCGAKFTGKAYQIDAKRNHNG